MRPDSKARWTRMAAMIGAVAAAGAVFAVRSGDAHSAAEPRTRAIQLQSIGVLHFAPNGTLFVADPEGAAIHALQVGDATPDTSTAALRIADIDVKIAAALGTTRENVRVVDMAAHPISKNLYFSVVRRDGGTSLPALVRVARRDAAVSLVSLDDTPSTSTTLADAPGQDAKMPWGARKRTFTITDLSYDDGELFVAGLSNEEFASTLRKVAFPFRSGMAATSVEIWHTSHDKFETASPIESMLPLSIGGKRLMVAGYACTPIVVISRDQLGTQKHVRGSTVSELGGGNRPVDMIRYRSPSNGREYVLIANSHRTLARFDADSLANGANLTIAVKQAYQPAGVSYLPVSSYGVLQLDAFTTRGAVLLVRDPEDGSLDVSTLGLNWL